MRIGKWSLMDNAIYDLGDWGMIYSHGYVLGLNCCRCSGLQEINGIHVSTFKWELQLAILNILNSALPDDSGARWE